jgi:hypothetical protein
MTLSAEKFDEDIGIFAQNKANFYKKLIITLVYEKNTHFCRKLEKIAENNDQNNGL